MNDTVANPQAGGAGLPPGQGPILEVRDLVKNFPVRGGFIRRLSTEVQAVSGVSFDVAAGETVGLLGPNGAGKTTTLSIMTGLTKADSGSVTRAW